MKNTTLHALETQIDQLIQHCQALSIENQALQAQVAILSEDKVILAEKNRIARTKIEMMISRLRAMDVNHD